MRYPHAFGVASKLADRCDCMRTDQRPQTTLATRVSAGPSLPSYEYETKFRVSRRFRHGVSPRIFHGVDVSFTDRRSGYEPRWTGNKGRSERHRQWRKEGHYIR